jgi:hypothetical protein
MSAKANNFLIKEVSRNMQLLSQTCQQKQTTSKLSTSAEASTSKSSMSTKANNFLVKQVSRNMQLRQACQQRHTTSKARCQQKHKSSENHYFPVTLQSCCHMSNTYCRWANHRIGSTSECAFFVRRFPAG